MTTQLEPPLKIRSYHSGCLFAAKLPAVVSSYNEELVVVSPWWGFARPMQVEPESQPSKVTKELD
jgi:hypothetical protein